MVNKLNEYAAHLGYGGAEIFPKQISRANDRDRGNWINLCYWDGDNTERYAISNGKKLSLMQFVKLAEQKTSTHDELMKSSFKLVDHFKDGPPSCLQHIMTMGFLKVVATVHYLMLEFTLEKESRRLARGSDEV